MSGTPNLAKTLLKHCMTTADVADLTPNALIHFKWASMITRSMWSSTGLAKSMWSLDQGLLGYSHGWSGALRDEARFCWEVEQCRTVCSICSSIFGHQTYILARLFILATPGCPQWSSSKICCLPGHLPHPLSSSPLWVLLWVLTTWRVNRIRHLPGCPQQSTDECAGRTLEVHIVEGGPIIAGVHQPPQFCDVNCNTLSPLTYTTVELLNYNSCLQTVVLLHDSDQIIVCIVSWLAGRSNFPATCTPEHQLR